MRLRYVFLTAALIGCGNSNPKIMTHDSNMQSVDAPPLPPGCDYAELADNANDNGVTQGATGVSEDTGFTDAIGKVICGTMDVSHFASGLIDVDSYQIALAADGSLRVDLVGTGLEALGAAEILITQGSGANIKFVDVGEFATNHAVAVRGLVAGTYNVAIFTADNNAPAAPIPYKIKLSAFTNACTAAVGTATHAEGNTDNDVLTFKYGASGVGFQHETIKGTDAFEPTGITLAANTNVSISGTIANSGAIDADDYLDRDTFEIASSAGVNEVTVRGDWTNKMADLDFFLTPKLTAPLATGDDWFIWAAANRDSGVGAAGTGGPEVMITAIDATTPWWVFAGGYTGSLALPSTYTVTICPTNVNP
jgi:hypothetical protein